MTCLFCKQNSDNSVSVEHIIPESLGNLEHILPKGLVCDKCNQYFALKVEKPLLEQPYFKNVRHRAGIENKKGRIPIEDATIIHPVLARAEIIFDKNDNIIVNLLDEEQAEKIASSPRGTMITLIIDEPESENKILSRFLAKVAVEGLLYYLLKEDGWIDEIMHKPELELIKKYARYGEGVSFWKYHQRRLYADDTLFNNPNVATHDYEVLHEFKILITKESHYYFVIAIMGIEYAINLGGPDYESYLVWLSENNHKSILDDAREVKSKR